MSVLGWLAWTFLEVLPCLYPAHVCSQAILLFIFSAPRRYIGHGNAQTPLHTGWLFSTSIRLC